MSEPQGGGRAEALAVAGGTTYVTLAHFVRVAMTIVYFLLLARLLGAPGLGVFAGALAITSVIAPAASLGSAHLLVRRVARNRQQFSRAWPEALGVTLLGSMCALPICVFAPQLLGWSYSQELMLLVGLAEFPFNRATDLSVRAALGMERSRLAGSVLLLVPAGRLVAVVVYSAVFVVSDPATWAFGFLVATALGSALSVGVVMKSFSLSRLVALRRGSRIWRERLAFVVADVSMTANSDADKAMLPALRTAAEGGIYTAAYRIVDATLLPIRSLLNVTYPIFFRRGSRGHVYARGFALRLLPTSLIYGVLVGALLWVAAPVLPTLLGESFDESASALRWMAIVPLLRGPQNLAADAIVGSGGAQLRASLSSIAAVLNIACNLLFIPRWGWIGAVWATLLSEAVLTVALWVARPAALQSPGGARDET